ncbi:hypothetical protein BDW22DRAFT_1431227 [Trametopsis cervina]|nr:hypothetical protein BDW22DRAFT_1431227 [Trametopsis cervina]
MPAAMDIDTRTAAFRILRSAESTNKRQRSPTSPSPYDRPNKRLTLGGVTNSFESPLDTPGGAMAPPSPLVQGQLPEDWLSKTQGLSIDKDRTAPVIAEDVAERRDGRDDSMRLDQDEPMSDQYHPNSTQDAMSNPQSSSNPLDMHSLTAPHQFAPDRLSPSYIPISQPFNTREHPYSASSIPTPLFSHVDVRPQQIALPMSPPKKQRYTMGPRSDCEKCRLGLPGHYSHLI